MEKNVVLCTEHINYAISIWNFSDIIIITADRIETRYIFSHHCIIYRTKVECGGQCMLTSTCSAFQFTDGEECRLFEATYLYKDVTDNNIHQVYMEDTLWNQRGNIVTLNL